MNWLPSDRRRAPQERVAGPAPVPRRHERGEPIQAADLVRAEARDPLQERIDADDPALAVEHQNDGLRRRDQALGEVALAAQGLLRLPPLGDVLDRPHMADQLALIGEDGAVRSWTQRTAPPRPVVRYSRANSPPAGASCNHFSITPVRSSGWMNRDQPSPRPSSGVKP